MKKPLAILLVFSPAYPVFGVCSARLLPRQGVHPIKGCEHQRYDGQRVSILYDDVGGVR